MHDKSHFEICAKKSLTERSNPADKYFSKVFHKQIADTQTCFLQVRTSKVNIGTALLRTARLSTMSTSGSVMAISLIFRMSNPYTLSQKSICR